MPSKPIYLDYMATTPVDPRVAKLMQRYLTSDGEFGNPASIQHVYGQRALRAVENARGQVAALLNATPNSIIWTSGATEADNLAIKGAAHFYQRSGKHIITSAIEHKAVLDSCQQLASEGFEVTYVAPQPNGTIDPQAIAKAMRNDTTLVSIMQVNNEIGTINPVKAIANIVHARGALLHVDAAQSAGKIAVDVNALDVDLLSIAAHKLYGPKGIGALYVRQQPRVRLQALLHGGGHERGLRSGTLPTHQIVGFGLACELAQQQLATEQQRISDLQQRFWQGLQKLADVALNGAWQPRIPHNLNVSFAQLSGEALLAALPGLAVATGSACTSATLEPSHVLLALGLNRERAQSAIRFSLGRWTSATEIDHALAQLQKAIAQLRQATTTSAANPSRQLYAELGHKTSGDVLQLTATIDDNDVITQADAAVYGSADVRHGADWLTEKMMGLTLTAAQQLTIDDLLAAVPMPTKKQHCARLVINTLRALTAKTFL